MSARTHECTCVSARASERPASTSSRMAVYVKARAAHGGMQAFGAADVGPFTTGMPPALACGARCSASPARASASAAFVADAPRGPSGALRTPGADGHRRITGYHDAGHTHAHTRLIDDSTRMSSCAVIQRVICFVRQQGRVCSALPTALGAEDVFSESFRAHKHAHTHKRSPLPGRGVQHRQLRRPGCQWQEGGVGGWVG